MSKLPGWVVKGTELEMKVTDSGIELGWTLVKVVRVNKNKIVLEFTETELSEKHKLTGKSVRLDMGGSTRSDRDDWNPADFRAPQGGDDEKTDEQAAQIEELRKALEAVQTQVKELEEKEEEEPEMTGPPAVQFVDVDGDELSIALNGSNLTYSCNGNLRIEKVDRIEVKEGKYGPRTLFFYHTEGTKWRFTACGSTTRMGRWVYNDAAYSRIAAFATLCFVDYIDDTGPDSDGSSSDSSESESDSSEDDDKKEKRRARNQGRKGKKAGKGGKKAERQAARQAARKAKRQASKKEEMGKEAKIAKLEAHREAMKEKIDACKEKLEKFNGRLEKLKKKKEKFKEKKEKAEENDKAKKVKKFTAKFEKFKAKIQKVKGKKQKTKKQMMGYRRMIQMTKHQIKSMKEE